MAPTEVTFGLSECHGLLTARGAHDWFLDKMHEHEEFVVETDRAGDLLSRSLSCLHSCGFTSRSYRGVGFSPR